jgi:hypothetical protein
MATVVIINVITTSTTTTTTTTTTITTTNRNTIMHYVLVFHSRLQFNTRYDFFVADNGQNSSYCKCAYGDGRKHVDHEKMWPNDNLKRGKKKAGLALLQKRPWCYTSAGE